MNKKTIWTITKAVVIIAVLLAVVFALKAPAADLHFFDGDNAAKAEYTDAYGLPYFSEMDSYFYLRLTEGYVDHGYVGDKLVNGSGWDMHRAAPDGRPADYESGIVYVASWLHDFVNNSLHWDLSVKEVAFWAGSVISTLAVIPAFIFARRITNDAGAIVSSMVIVLAPNYFAHTFPGFFDTDMFYYILAIFFVFFFVETIRNDNWIVKILCAILSIVSVGLFSQTWTGYIFYVALMGLFAVVYLIMILIFKVGGDRSEYSNPLSWLIHQKDFWSIIMMGIIGFGGLIVFKGVDGALGIFGSVFNLLNLQSASVVVGGFPNVLISVAEMQMPNLIGSGMNAAFLASTDGMINGIGGIAIFFAGLIVLYVLASRVWKNRKVKTTSSNVSNNKSKPQKGKRLAASKKLDDSRKFKIALSDLSFGKDNEILGDKRLTLLYATLFIVWVVVTALAVSRGSRFITTIVLPFGLMAGIFVGFAWDYIKSKMNNDKILVVCVFLCAFLAGVPLATINTTYGILLFAAIMVCGLISVYAIKSNSASGAIPLKKYVLITALVIALVAPSVCGAYSISHNVVPGTSDSMWNAMQWIDQTQPEDTVITSWWDFGYLFEIAADRQVTFDGGSQSGQRAFWLGQAMTTSDLELSAGIFRMLDSTGDKAVTKLVNITNNTGQSTDILIDILPKTADDAQKDLINKYGLSKEDAQEVISYTHPKNPRPVIFVASSDMLQKAGWWSYFGAWDFEKQNSTNYNYFVIQSGPQQVEVQKGQEGKISILSEGGVNYNAVIERGNGNNTTKAHMECLLDNGSELKVNGTPINPLKASNILLVEDGQIMKSNESVEGADDGNYTLFLMGQNNQYTPILMSNKLANSMFTQLYLLGGAGQNIFENVHMENGVMLFKVNFENTKAGGHTSSNSTSGTNSSAK